MKAEEQFLDVLQNIEFAIITVYRRNRALLDHDVHDAVEAAIRYYNAEERGQDPPSMRLSEPAQGVFEAIRGVCEWRLGRTPAVLEGPLVSGGMAPLAVADLLLCLRQIDKSIRRWSSVGGRKGYLDYVGQFIP